MTGHRHFQRSTDLVLLLRSDCQCPTQRRKDNIRQAHLGLIWFHQSRDSCQGDCSRVSILDCLVPYRRHHNFEEAKSLMSAESHVLLLFNANQIVYFMFASLDPAFTGMVAIALLPNTGNLWPRWFLYQITTFGTLPGLRESIIILPPWDVNDNYWYFVQWSGHFFHLTSPDVQRRVSLPHCFSSHTASGMPSVPKFSRPRMLQDTSPDIQCAVSCTALSSHRWSAGERTVSRHLFRYYEKLANWLSDVWQNKRRAKKIAEMGISPEESARIGAMNAEADMTDFDNIHFKYQI